MFTHKPNKNILMAFTARFVKACSDCVIVSDYEKLKEIFNANHIEHTMYYEIDKHRGNGLHVHGTLSIPKNVYRKTMIEEIKQQGYYFNLQYINTIGDLKRWHEYCLKEQKNISDYIIKTY